MIALRRFIAAHVALTLLLCSCGHGTDKVRQAVDATAATEAVIAKGFVAWDKQHQMELVSQDKGLTYPTDRIMADLSAYRAKRAKVVEMMQVLERSLASAPLILALVDRGMMGNTDLDKYLSEALALYQQVLGLLSDLGFNVNGLPGGVSP